MSCAKLLRPTLSRNVTGAGYPSRSDRETRDPGVSRRKSSDVFPKCIIPRPCVERSGFTQRCLRGIGNSNSYRKKCGPLRFSLPRLGLPSQQDIVWQSCDTFGVERPFPGLYCSHVEVPMDYHNSSAGIANIAVIKYTPVESGKSKGSIFINPGGYRRRPLPGSNHTDLSWEGGPGGPGTFALPGLAKLLSAIFDNQYDIVSWDPRGSASYYTLYGYLSNLPRTHLPDPQPWRCNMLRIFRGGSCLLAGDSAERYQRHRRFQLH